MLQPPSPTGNFQFTQHLHGGPRARPARRRRTPATASLRSCWARSRGSASTRSRRCSKPRATIAEFFLQDDWRATSRLTLNLGVRYTLNFPSTVADDRGAVFNLQTQKLDYFGQNGFPRSARNLEKTNFGPRVGLAYRITDSFVVRSGYSLTWIEQAGITTPFTTPLFPFIQTLGQQTLDNINPAFVLSQGPTVTPQPPRPGCRPRPGRLRRAAGQRQRLRAAVEPQPAEDVRRELERGGRLPGLEADAPRRARRQPEPAHRGTARARIAAHPAGAESLLRPDPAEHLARDARRSRARSSCGPIRASPP